MPNTDATVEHGPDNEVCAPIVQTTETQTGTQTQSHSHSYFMDRKLLRVCLAFHTNFLASIVCFRFGDERHLGCDKRTVGAAQLSRGRSRNESLSNKQSTCSKGENQEKKCMHKKGGKKFAHALSICWTTMGQGLHAGTLPSYSFFGACQQSKIINIPNFEKRWKKICFYTLLFRVQRSDTASH